MRTLNLTLPDPHPPGRPSRCWSHVPRASHVSICCELTAHSTHKNRADNFVYAKCESNQPQMLLTSGSCSSTKHIAIEGLDCAVHQQHSSAVRCSSGGTPCMQAEPLWDVKEKLRAMDIPFVEETVVEGGIEVTQVFFLDPESNMIEVMLRTSA